MLQRVEPVVGEFADLGGLRGVRGNPDAEDAAGVLGTAVRGVELMGQSSISMGHEPSLRALTRCFLSDPCLLGTHDGSHKGKSGGMTMPGYRTRVEAPPEPRGL